MKKFIKNLNRIKAIAKNVASSYGNRFQSDELVNAAYIRFENALSYNPELSDKDDLIILRRAKYDMIDYIRSETSFRRKYQINEISTSFIKDEKTGVISFEQEVEEDGFEKIDNEDFLNHFLKNVPLSDEEWRIIQGYFYDEKTLKTLGQEINRTEATMCVRKNKLVKKLQSYAPIF